MKFTLDNTEFNLTFKDVANMKFTVFAELCETLNELLNNIILKHVPDHIMILDQFAELDKLRGVINLLNMVVSSQSIMVVRSYENEKKKCGQGKNETERKAAAVELCENYHMSPREYQRIFYTEIEQAVKVNLVELSSVFEAKETMIEKLTSTLNRKQDALTQQSCLIKNERQAVNGRL